MQEGASSLTADDLKRIGNENKELRLMVRIDRVKVRNVPNYQNLFCKFKFAENVPVKVVVSVFSSGVATHTIVCRNVLEVPVQLRIHCAGRTEVPAS